MHYGYLKKLLNKKNLRYKGEAGSGTVFVIIVVLMMVAIAFTFIGGKMPQMDNSKIGSQVVLVTSAPQAAKNYLQLYTFIGLSITPSPTPTPTPPPQPTVIPPPTDAQTNPLTLTPTPGLTASTCTGTGVRINSDKTLCVNGKKTFPVGMYGIFYDSLNSFPVHPEMTKDFLFRVPSLRWEWYPGTAKTGYINSVDSFVNNGQFLLPLSSMVSSLTVTERNGAGLFGYMLPDEPDLIYKSDTQTPAQVKALSDDVKKYDSVHPTILNVTMKYGGISSLYAYRDSADILMWDDYSVTNTPSGIDPGATWARADSSFAHEWRVSRGAFLNVNTESFTKPIWEVVQAYGQNYNGYLDVMTPAEIRTMTYLSITMNVNGVVYYTFHSGSGSPDDGLYTNSTELGYYAAQARELHSINNILVMPTIGYSWYGHPDGNTVSFTGSSLTKTFVYSTSISMQNYPKVNYILKGDSSGKYLIVVNKDASALNGVTVTIPSLSSVSRQISLVLNETSVGGAGGRTLTMTNGRFTDNFAAKAVHIYQLN